MRILIFICLKKYRYKKKIIHLKKSPKNHKKQKIQKIEKKIKKNLKPHLKNMEHFNKINKYVISKLNGEFSIFSPLSLTYALCLVYIGSSGDTTKLFKELFEGIKRRELLEELLFLNKKLQLCEITNGIFINKIMAENNKVSDSFQIKMDSLKTKIEEIEMNKDSVKKINKWIDKSTKGIFKDVIKELTEESAVLLINCIYFKGDWVNSFNNRLETKSFNDKPAKLMTMSKSIELKYFENKEYQTVEIPYKLEKSDKKSNIVFGIILPKKKSKGNYFDLEYDFSKYYSLLKDKNIDLVIPPFSFNRKYDLENFCNKLGLGNLYNRINIKKILDNNDLFISNIIQDVYIKVDQKGTIAAAVTVVSCEESDCESNEDSIRFVADHSFTFYIRDTKLDIILFTGTLTELKDDFEDLNNSDNDSDNDNSDSD